MTRVAFIGVLCRILGDDVVTSLLREDVSLIVISQLAVNHEFEGMVVKFNEGDTEMLLEYRREISRQGFFTFEI